MTARVAPLHDVTEREVGAWQELATEALEPNPFLHPDLVLAAARHLDPRREVGLLRVERRGTLTLVLPVVRRRQHRRVPVPVVTTWWHPYCFLGTPLALGAGLEETWVEALDVLGRTAPWAALPQVYGDRGVDRSCASALRARHRSVATVTRAARPVLIAGGAPYLSRVSGSRRSKLKRLRPRLASELGEPVEVVDRARPGEDLDAAVTRLLDLERSGWKGRDGGAIACDAAHAAFFRELCHTFAARGALQLRELTAGAAVLGHQCNLVDRGVVHGFKTTYDEAYHRFSPGVVLFLDTVAGLEGGEGGAYDSCMGASTSTFGDLFPDRRPVLDLFASLRPALGDAVVGGVPRAVEVLRRSRDVAVGIRGRAAVLPGARRAGGVARAGGE